MKIGIDLDEVIVDFMDALLKFYYEKTGRLHKKEEFLENKWWPVWGITREEAIKITDEFHETHILAEVKPIKNAVKHIQELLTKEDELFVITARPSRFQKKAEEWINHHLETNKIKVFPAGDFYKGQAANKAEICNEQGIKIMLEDSGDTALECADSGIKVLLFDQPWNKDIHHENIVRVNGWEEAGEEINKLKKII